MGVGGAKEKERFDWERNNKHSNYRILIIKKKMIQTVLQITCLILFLFDEYSNVSV